MSCSATQTALRLPNYACSRRQRPSRRLRAGFEETSVGEKASVAPGAPRLKLSLGQGADGILTWHEMRNRRSSRLTLITQNIIIRP